MHSGNDKKGFDAEKWKRENTAPGGGKLLSVEKERFDDHRDTARRIEERKRQSKQSGSSMELKTNFTLQSDGKKDYIVVSFDRGMDRYQCREYLDNIKRKIVGEFYGIEERDTDKVVLNIANLIFNIESFPFNTSKGELLRDEQNGFKFVIPIDEGVIFNLKSHLASSLAKDVREDIRVSSTTVPFTKGEYLCHSKFPNKELRKQFEREFLSRMRERYENVPKNPLKVEGNSVYIKDVFDDARFIDSVTRHVAWLKGMGLQDDSKNYSKAKAFKDLIIEFINQSTGLTVVGFIRNFPLNEKTAKILVPVVLDNGEPRVLASEEALKLSYTFDYAVFNNLYSKVQAELPINGGSGIYGIDFSNKEISHCVITKIIESSVINAKHELSIDPELHFRALSPVQSPFNSPIHAGPSGLRTPPNPRKRNRDSGIGESPPKPEDSVAHSPSGDPSSYFTESLSPTQEFPTRDQNVVLKDSPRRESEKFPVLLPVNQLDVPGTSREFLPRSHLSSSVTNPHSSKCVGAVQNVQAGTSAWSQPINPWPSPAPSAEPSLWSQSGPSSWKGASEWRTSDKPLTEEEEKLSKALLYWFNLNNYALDPPHTNFIVKNGKIASLIDDSVDVKEYLQEVIDKTKEEYYVNKKEAYGLNEFPFKFLSNCEKNQETTVVANISRGALLNLKEFFSQEHEGKVEIKDIDINIVKKAVKSKQDKWVNFQVREHGLSPKAAIETCCPDESALEYISITKGEGGHWIDRNYDASEVKSFREERWPAKGTSKAEKMKSEDNKDSGYSSGFVTDAENVSSKAEATTSGYESMDCENTRGGSPKRKSPSPEDGGNPRKSPKRDSLPLSRLESLSLSSSSHQIDIIGKQLADFPVSMRATQHLYTGTSLNAEAY
uniref:Uncharacterized protein n=1 Tax=Glossina austeni TaxID=7395 RepID=A0A1A9VJW7_GLOAU